MIYQEEFDHARMIVCRYSMDDDFDMKDKRVIFKPIVIDMLDVVSIPIQDERGQQSRVDCWMEITKGRFPQTEDIDGAVRVGSPLTLAIYVKDPRKRTDIRVKDCYAYDDPKIAESNGPALLQLSDFDGCPTRPNLMEVWKRTADTGLTGATIVAFTTVTAFKFPDRPDLQLTCNIELCRNNCSSRCKSEMEEPVSVGNWTKTSIDQGGTEKMEGDDDDAKEEEADKSEGSEDGEDSSENETTQARSAGEDGEVKDVQPEDADTEEKSDEAEEKDGEDNNEAEEKEDTENSEAKSDSSAEIKSEEDSGDKEETEESDDTKEDEDKAEPRDDNETEADEEEAGDEDKIESAKRATKNDDEDEEEEENNETEEEESTTTTTTTTKAPSTARKQKKKAKISKNDSPTTTTKPRAKVFESEDLDNSITAVFRTKTNKGSGLKMSATNHLSTTTLRPLKELMDTAKKVSKIVKKVRKSKGTTTTTTTTTTTMAPTTTKKPKRFTRPARVLRPKTTTTESSLRGNSRRARHSNHQHLDQFVTTDTPMVSESQHNPVVIFYDQRTRNSTTPMRTVTRPPMIINKTNINNNNRNSVRRLRDYSDSDSASDFRSFYSYSNFQPQRIRSRTVRSVDAVLYNHKRGNLVLGARVITGLEVVR